ncbi:MAG: hypothetical protein D4R48_03530 [Nitrosomonadales bacterium]|nr:MAG: hypothetical protein D4R48_03530 [Nitrosomonadales bacterium]
MPKSIAIKLDKSQLVGLFTLLGMAAAFIKLALAITAFTPQNQPTGYVAQDEMSNYNLTSGTETLYRVEYEKETWSGNLYAYPVDAAGNLNTSAERWTGGAKTHIDAQNYSTGRLIATMKDDGTAIAFLSASMSATQQSSLAATIQGTAYTSTQIVSFLRGDRSNEGASALRVRSSALGDIIHSRPYFVADATNPTIFVGANDGMLHAINTANGTERWAYVPSMLLSKMKALAANPYTHDYYVDGQINIADIVVSGTTKNVLVGGLGAGGRGLYALDITTLTAANEAAVASKVLWEITPSKVNYANPTVANAYTNLGYTYGTPTIGQTEDGSYAAIVGNGYNDGGGSCNPASATTGSGSTLATTTSDCQAYLYVINAATGQRIMAIKAGTSGTAASPNGLSTPAAVDVNSNGKIDRVYAGDLNGTMWKFDLSSATPSSWTATALYTTSPAQPITATPGIAIHPNGGYMVNFGTGQMFSYTFPSSTRTLASDPVPSGTDADRATVYYVYGIWDGAPVANTTLVTQTLTERSYTDPAGTTTRVRRSSAIAPTWISGGNKGWQVALPAGERVIGEGSFIESGRFYFTSYNPNVGYAVPNTTTNEYGENWLNELNYLTGGSSTLPFLDMDGNLLLNNADRIVYTAADTKPAGKATGDPIVSPNEDGIPVSKWISRGVQSQPVLVNLATLNTTLFNQNPDVTFPAAATGDRGVAGGHFDVEIYSGTDMGCSNVAGTGAQAVGYVDFTYNNNLDLSSFSITVGGVEILTSNNPPSLSRSGLETWVKNNSSSANYTITTGSNKIKIQAKNVGIAYNATIVVSATGLASGDRTITNVANGTDAAAGGPYSDSSTSCQLSFSYHKHEYDDAYDKTGVNFLNASWTTLNLSNAITSTATNFKVLMMNQYLSPAVSLHIGNASYDPASSAGYVSVKNYQTSAGLDISTVPSYTLNTIGSLAINMPVDAFTIKDWWGNGDTRTGLHPTSPQCVFDGPLSGGGSAAADLYNPVIPPTNGTNGPGTAGTSTGVRHNGALTLEIIKDTTPASAIEENVAGRPEYGYRVKQANYYTYVLAEYTIFWHHPRRICYDDNTHAWYNGSTGGNGLATLASGKWNTDANMVGTGWTKDVPQDTTAATANTTPAAGSTDPKLGTLGASGTVASTTVTVVSNVTTTTTTYVDGTKTVVVRTSNADGTVTIVTTNYAADNTVTSTTTATVADTSGSVKTGGDERGLQARTGRISWHELVRD